MRRIWLPFLVTAALVLAGCQSVALLPDGRVLLVGGGTAALFDPATGTLTPTGTPTSPRYVNTTTVLGDGRVLFAGGTSDGEKVLKSAELYDPQTGSFSATGELASRRMLHAGTLLADGRVIVTGGTKESASGEDEPVPGLASCELYDPVTGTWAATGDLVDGRAGHTATLLADGRVVILGGAAAQGLTLQAELYDPDTGAFVAAGSLLNGRLYHSATLLHDGRVLLVGGMKIDDPSADATAEDMLDSAELYDPSSGTFGATGQLTSPRIGHSATLLADGRVLIAGGLSAEGSPLSTAEVYDPMSGTSAPTGALTKPRALHSAILLADGRVLLVGGDATLGSSDPVDMSSVSLEIYDPTTGTFE